MFKFLLLLLVSIDCFAATTSQNLSYTVNMGGGASASNSGGGGAGASATYPIGGISDLISLVAGSSGVAANAFMGFYLAGANGGTQYQVTTGKIFYILSVYCFNQLATAGNQFGYGTAAIASEGTGTAPTGAVYFGAAGTPFSTPFMSTAGSTFSYYQTPGMKFPALSYPFMKATTINNATGCNVIGIEK